MKRTSRVVLAWSGLGLLVIVCATWRWMDLLGDSFWYVASGRLVLDTGHFPRDDPFTFASSATTFAGGPSIMHMPLAEVFFAWVERHAGLFGLLTTATLVEATAVAVLWLASTRGSARALAVTLPVAAFAVWMQRDDLCARGQVFGDLAWAVLVLGIARLRDGRRIHVALPCLLGAFWVNFHSSFPLAIVTPLAVALVARPARPFVIVAIAGALGTLANPYGPALLTDVARLASDPTTQNFDLFRSPDFQQPEALLAVGLAVALVPFALRRSRADAVLLLVGLGAACWARRNLFLLVGYELVLVGDLTSRSSRIAAARVPRWVALAAGAGAGAGALALLLGGPAKDPLTNVPAAAAALVERDALPDRVAAEYHWGGYFDYAWMGRRRTLIDGRSYLFLNGVLEDAEQLRTVAPGWKDVLDVYEIHTIVWERGSALDSALEQAAEWTCVHRDRLAVVYVRAGTRAVKDPAPPP